tara:strand:- start:503 stop:883 length:381 start_codon:yes stop_codon:yes gene_type:complete
MTELKTLAQYIISHPPLEVDCDLLSDLILAVQNSPDHDPDDAVAGVVIGDAEVLFGLAEDAQEAAEIEWEMAANNPDHPRHHEVWAELNAIKPVDPVKAAMESWVSDQDPAKLDELNKKLNKILKK